MNEELPGIYSHVSSGSNPKTGLRAEIEKVVDDKLVEITDARTNQEGVTFPTLPDRLNSADVEINQVKELSTSTSEKLVLTDGKVTNIDNKVKLESNITPSLNALWNPPTMPDTLRGNGLVPTSYHPDVQLAALMDPLVDNVYVTKRSIGKSQATLVDGTPVAADSIYDTWCYEFTPENPEKTILLTAMIHGNEYTTFYWMAQFLDLLVNKWHEHPQLAYLRKNVKIVTVPIANPWGHMNNKRYNVNGVDCSRNFAYNWGNVFDEYPQGTAAWSEAEARNIRDLMAEIAPETVAALDFHTTLSEGDTHHMIYYPRFLQNDISKYIGVIDALIQPGETTAFATTVIPTLTNWGIFTHGFNAANPEFKNALDGNSTRDSAEMTRAMKFFGNFVFQAANQPAKAKFTTIATPKFADIKFDHRTDGGPITFATLDYTSQATKTAVKFKMKNEGVFKVSGDITVSSSVDAEVSIIPHLYQVQSPDFAFGPTSTSERHAIIINLKAGVEQRLHFQTAIRAHKTNILAANNTNERTQEVVFQLRTKTTAGTGSIKFIDALAEFHPTTSGDSYVQLNTNPARYVYPISEGVTYEF